MCSISKLSLRYRSTAAHYVIYVTASVQKGAAAAPACARGLSDSPDQSRRPSVPAAAIAPLAHHRRFRVLPCQARADGMHVGVSVTRMPARAGSGNISRSDMPEQMSGYTDASKNYWALDECFVVPYPNLRYSPAQAVRCITGATDIEEMLRCNRYFAPTPPLV
jgi:hypothetical protein